MKNKIEFNWELYKSGLYDVVTRYGIKVEQLHKFSGELDFNLCGVIGNSTKVWDHSGSFYHDDDSDFDLFLIPKEKEECIAEGSKTIIPELKGVLMEVSDEEDFVDVSQELIIGRLNGLYISNALESWCYARPIKEVKEVWLNVFEDDGNLIVGQSHFDSKEEAIKFKSTNVKYIKTIRVTNEKDGE